MKIYLLTIKAHANGGYDSYDGHVVQADSEGAARALCEHGAEGNVWSDPYRTDCIRVGKKATGPAQVLLSSFCAG